MEEFFRRKLGFGRRPDWTVGEVFTQDRRYFDQILYKNHKFRHEYALAYAAWLSARDGEESPLDLLAAKIRFAISVMGEEKTKKLFGQALAAAGLPPDMDYASTLPGGSYAKAGSPGMDILARFWQRLALPEVREEDQGLG